jgi:hypothetical protein
MTITKFRSSPELTAGLYAALQNPTLQTALTAIKESALVAEPPPQVPGVHHDTTIAHALHKQMGVIYVLKCLDTMTRQAKDAPQVEGEYDWATENIKPFQV